MAVANTRFAQKATSIAPLTAAASAFSPSTHAKPDFKQGKVVVANFEFPQTLRLRPFGPSYSEPPPVAGEGGPS